MSTLNFVTNIYADFTFLIKKRAVKGFIFYNLPGTIIPGSSFVASWVADDFSNIITITNLPAAPPTFLTDFPDAMQTLAQILAGPSAVEI